MFRKLLAFLLLIPALSLSLHVQRARTETEGNFNSENCGLCDQTSCGGTCRVHVEVDGVSGSFLPRCHWVSGACEEDCTTHNTEGVCESYEYLSIDGLSTILECLWVDGACINGESSSKARKGKEAISDALPADFEHVEAGCGKYISEEACPTERPSCLWAGEGGGGCVAAEISAEAVPGPEVYKTLVNDAKPEGRVRYGAGRKPKQTLYLPEEGVVDSKEIELQSSPRPEVGASTMESEESAMESPQPSEVSSPESQQADAQTTEDQMTTEEEHEFDKAHATKAEREAEAEPAVEHHSHKKRHAGAKQSKETRKAEVSDAPQEVRPQRSRVTAAAVMDALSGLGRHEASLMQKNEQASETDSEYVDKPHVTLLNDITESLEETQTAIKQKVMPVKMKMFPALTLMTGEDKLSRGYQKSGGNFETQYVNMILELWKENGSKGNLLDVGANLGSFTLPFALQASENNKKVIAVEALPFNCQMLRASIKENQLGNVRLYEYAVGNVTWADSARFWLGGGNSGHAAYAPNKGQVTADVTTLDSILSQDREMENVFAMKLDIEGTEPSALDGGKNWLAKYPPCILVVETNRQAPEHNAKLDRIITQWGFVKDANPMPDQRNSLYLQENMDKCVERMH